ncbi:MAG: hypothetical protein WAK96_03305, partial [Desulfobaccales bacterium]
NYLPEVLLNQAIATVHPRTHGTVRWERFADLTHIRPDKNIDKVAVARVITGSAVDFGVLDLEVLINQLLLFL